MTITIVNIRFINNKILFTRSSNIITTDDFRAVSNDDICSGIVNLDNNAIAASAIVKSGNLVGYYENEQLMTRLTSAEQIKQKYGPDYVQNIKASLQCICKYFFSE